jgi:hypothetical protein
MAEKQIGIYHMTDNPSLYEVGRSNNFEFIITGVNSLLKAGALVTEETAQEGDRTSATADDTIRLSVVSASVPHFQQDEIMIQRGNMKMYAAGLPSFNDGTIEVNDYIGLDTKSVILAWQRLSFDVTTQKIGRMADYKKSCTLIEYTPDYKIIRKWRLDGCWIKNVADSGDFNMEEGGKRTVTATIRFDRAMPIYDEE